ncbi:MAG: hypothetical protein JOZ75_14785 [Candidatus Dormibacteraeota bacterium]|nr:hypothetical protein [Candidatus Dormibacteraeota bacterium]
MKLLGLLIAAVAAASLAACGGGASNATNESTQTTMSPSTRATPSSTPNSAMDAYPIMSSLDGHLTGPWTNTTFKTTGTMTWDVTSDAVHRTVTIAIMLTGNVLGAAAPATEHIELTHLATGVVQGPSAAFGTVNGVITPDGRIHFQLTNLPQTSIATVDIAGIVKQGTSIAFGYTVTMTNASTAQGTVTLTKQ